MSQQIFGSERRPPWESNAALNAAMGLAARALDAELHRKATHLCHCCGSLKPTRQLQVSVYVPEETVAAFRSPVVGQSINLVAYALCDGCLRSRGFSPAAAEAQKRIDREIDERSARKAGELPSVGGEGAP